MCFIGFSGTHGKTTTSGLCSYVLNRAELGPSFVVGGIIPDINTNAQHKNGKYFIAELDESDGTIVKYNPDILVINNLEEDHVDYYKNGLLDLVDTFNTAVKNSKKVIINNDNEGLNMLNGEFVTFGLNDADYTAKNIKTSEYFTTFDVYYKENLLADIKIQLAGTHNVYNTLATIAALHEAGVDIDLVKEYYKDFTGMGRRFQKVCTVNGAEVYDDYAHHPTEIKATLEAAAAKFGKEHIIAVFQPHRYTRLQGLWDDFKAAFGDANRVIVTDVFAASENPINGITAVKFASELEGAEYYSGSIGDVARKLLPTLHENDIVIGLGAGTITVLGKELEKAAGYNKH
jgi:UDP-N-acetylmuramate--alanine ligase